MTDVTLETKPKFTAKQLAFIAWLAMPFDRVPPDHGGMAAKLQVTERTLYYWQKNPALQEEVNRQAMELVRRDVPKLLRAGVEHALAGKFDYWKALLQMAGVIVPDKPSGAQDNRTQVIILNGPDTTDRPWHDAPSGPSADYAGAQALQRGGLWSALGQNGNGHGPAYTNGHVEE